MKILFIFHYSRLKGGANISGLNLVRELKALGHELEVIVPADGDLCSELEMSGIEYNVIPFRTAWPYTIGSTESYVKFFPRAIRNNITNRRALGRIVKRAEKFKPDIIHSNSSVISIGAKAAKKLGIPHVTHFREFGFRDTGFVDWHIPNIVSSRGQFNIAISKDIAKFHNLTGDRSIVIYNGIYPRSAYAEKLKSHSPKGNYLLYVGGIYEAKGIDDLLEAYSRLDAETRRNHPLWLAGASNSDRYESRMRQKAIDLGIDKDIRWLGQRRDVAELMKNAKALIVASYAEAFGRIMAEAAFNGCPVIARDACGLHEQFENGVELTGKEIGFRFNTVEELSMQIQRVLNSSPDDLKEMLDAGYTTALKLYTNESNAEAVTDFYNTILTNKLS
ncbi:MAG: glycosyltransferase family 4 protein [Muribaculaceae bacterium]|nr:glycosyltransferase family 4 protein [Muribaculaceae bacterium]